MTAKQNFARYRNQLSFQRFPEYLKWMKEKNPNLDLHHLFCSNGKLKFTDAFVVPIEHFFHLGKVHLDRAKYCFEFLQGSLQWFCYYCIEKGLCTEEEFPKDMEPETLANFIELIYHKTREA